MDVSSERGPKEKQNDPQAEQSRARVRRKTQKFLLTIIGLGKFAMQG